MTAKHLLGVSEITELLERGQAFANQVRHVTYLLHGQAYSTTVSELNAFDAALRRLPAPPLEVRMSDLVEELVSAARCLATVNYPYNVRERQQIRVRFSTARLALNAEIERLQRELAEAREFRAILEGHLSAAIDDYNDARRQPEGLSKWAGWDQSNMPWTEAKHKDRVCYAAFGETWSMEDAHALISFIDRTWGAKAQPHSETRQEQR